MLVTLAETDQVIVIERIEVEAPMGSDVVTQSYTTDQPGCKPAVFLVEFPIFIKVVEIYIIICHPICLTLYTCLEPIAGVAAQERMPSQFLPTEGEVGHHGQHQVRITILRENRLEVIEVAVHPVRTLHIAEVGAEGKPLGEGIAGL